MRKPLKLSAEAAQLIELQREAFIQKFGREPRPEDPIFFDPDADEPRPDSMQKYVGTVVSAMEKAGIDAALIYAYKKTGRIVTERNLELLTEEELKEWKKTVDDYRTMVAMGLRPV